MKFLFDFLPVALFFIAFKFFGIYAATGVAIAATIFQVSFSWFKHRRVETMHLVTLGLVTVLGGATILFKDERFIKWKPTLVNWAFATAFLGSQFVGEKPIIERMMGHAITLPQPVWTRLSVAWVMFFTFLGFANLYVAFNFDLDTWVNFKMFGMMALTFVFVILQGIFLSRYMEEKPEEPRA